jgi:SAM-dependent methyltransferase
MIYDLMKKNSLCPNEVVEVGCGSGAILQELARRDAAIHLLKGFDISPQALEMARGNSNERIQFYDDDITADEYFKTDLILVIDVLEHVDDYYSMLRRLKSKADHFIFHIPLDLSCRTLFKPHVLLEQRQELGHIHYFSRQMVEWALEDTGYTIIDWHYTKPFSDTQSGGNMKRRLKRSLRNLSWKLSQNKSAKLWGDYSMLILAK